jgi:hypothetical protein
VNETGISTPAPLSGRNEAKNRVGLNVPVFVVGPDSLKVSEGDLLTLQAEMLKGPSAQIIGAEAAAAEDAAKFIDPALNRAILKRTRPELG